MPALPEASGHIDVAKAAFADFLQIPGLEFTRKEMTVVGSHASVNCFPESLQLLASGKIQYPRVATEISMWDAPPAFAKLNENPRAMHKGVLVC